ncbi:hypothetical protein C8Q73DRAFT_710337 [Cubamyces lactineus]|nr:hypothetical protein C8Q73DRAFT_710337 [Cubamyces lactineus]
MRADMDVEHVPLDVLFSVMAVSPCNTISAMMRTCRTLYNSPESSRLLLRDVLLASDKQIVSFLHFMLADPTTRFSYLRALTFAKGCFLGAAVDALRDLLVPSHPSLTIETLTSHDAEAVLASGMSSLYSWRMVSFASVPLLEPFARLTTLKYLTMDAADACASAFLRMLPASLVSVSLDFSDSMGSLTSMLRFRDYDAATFLNPILSLHCSTETLKVLEGSGFSLPRADTLDNPVYPHVWKVRASFKHGTWERMAVVYARAFPNLKHLVLNKYIEKRRYVPDTDSTRLVVSSETVRRGNREGQLKYGSWRSLRVVEGTLGDIYVLGLVCKVPQLHLKEAVAENMVPCLEAVLQDVQPDTLSLAIRGTTTGNASGTVHHLAGDSDTLRIIRR